MNTRVLLVDDHAILRESVHMVLDSVPGVTVVGEAEDGHQAVEMVDLLYLSIKTVPTHRSHIMDKLGAHDRTDLVKAAVRMGMIPAE